MPRHHENADTTFPLRNDLDVLKVRQYGNDLARPLHFTSCERAMIAIVIAEIARNTVLYAIRGRMLLKVLDDGQRRGIHIVAEDEGPGIPNIALAMQDGYTTSQGLGIGLPGARRLMDEFDIVSEVGKGTTITMTKWETGE